MEKLQLELNEIQSDLGVTETKPAQKVQKIAAPVIKPIDVS